MKENKDRRLFLKNVTLSGLGASIFPGIAIGKTNIQQKALVAAPGLGQGEHTFNKSYSGANLRRIAFPVGGIGAGMFCVEGSGAISHMSVHHRPQLFNEPTMFAALFVKGKAARVIEGPVPEWKIFGRPNTGNGSPMTTYGLPRFDEATFLARFPFCSIQLKSSDMPLQVELTGWSPFIPGDPDNSSLPAGALEYRFTNHSTEAAEAVFSYNSRNFMLTGDQKGTVKQLQNGFVLAQEGTAQKPQLQGHFAIYTDDSNTVTDHCWFRGGWWDPLTMIWNTIKNGEIKNTPPVDADAPGASLFVPFTLQPGENKTVRVMMAWYVPFSDMHIGDVNKDKQQNCAAPGCCNTSAELGATVNNDQTVYRPWYSSRFKDIHEIAAYWKAEFNDLYNKTSLFTKAFSTVRFLLKQWRP